MIIFLYNIYIFRVSCSHFMRIMCFSIICVDFENLSAFWNIQADNPICLWYVEIKNVSVICCICSWSISLLPHDRMIRSDILVNLSELFILSWRIYCLYLKIYENTFPWDCWKEKARCHWNRWCIIIRQG